MKRVGILTLPLWSNYGGILQAVALYELLAGLGVQPVFLSKSPIRSSHLRLAASILGHVPGQNIGGVRARAQVRRLHSPFIERYLPEASPRLRTSQDLAKAVEALELDAVVVGSDQVWRLDYHMDDFADPMIYFLGFAEEVGIQRVSYAASFGDSTWSYPDWTEPVSLALKQFDAVSVRERTGREICASVFSLPDVPVVLDPTMMVDTSFYKKMLNGQSISDRTVALYVLDRGFATEQAAKVVRSRLGSDVLIRSFSPDDNTDRLTVPDWLRVFATAEAVVTDSFHGTIFAILFEKQFVTVPNHKRGVDRFRTLLDQLGLSDRLLEDSSPDSVGATLEAPIHYDEVRSRLEGLRATSRAFLTSALEGTA